MKKIAIVLPILFLMNCSEKESEKNISLAADNPFNVDLNQPFDYAKVTGEDIAEYVSFKMEEALQTLEKIKNEKKPTLENTFVPFDAVFNSLYQANNNAYMLYWTSTDSLTRAKGIEYSKKVDSLNTIINSDKTLFTQFKTVVSSPEYETFDNRTKRFVDDIMDSFEQSGVNLEENKLAELKTLKAEIADLTSQYSLNMNTANAVLTLNEAEAEGLPESFKNTYRAEDGTYNIPVIPATQGPVMGNAVNAEVRKNYLTLYATRGAAKNMEILNQLVEKRYKIGQLMGYDSYADYNLVLKMAKNPETVWDFINGLVEASKEKALQDVAVLKTARKELEGISTDQELN